MNFEFQNFVMHILKFFFLCLGFQKMPSRFLFITHLLYLLYIIFLGEKWFTCSVFSPTTAWAYIVV
jgi:hypothetical protein